MTTLKPGLQPVTPPDSDRIERTIRSQSRLAAVRRTGLLDSAPEESLDSLSRLAARLLKAPASFLAIVDAERDFYKSHHGFPDVLAKARQLSGRTFCHYAMQCDDALVINDTHGDPIWKAIPTVESLGVRAYVGVPLRIGGEVIGSFCVIDTKPREWLTEELETLRELAISAGRELSLRNALAAAADEAQYSRLLARSREQVVAVVAHDLRTPLQILQLSAIALRGNSNGQHNPDMERMFRAIEAMKTMTESLLSSSALLLPSTDSRKPVTASLLLQDAVEMMKPLAERAAIALTLDRVPEAALSINYAQMLRVLGNVIGNAIKHSPEGSAVSVGALRTGNHLVLTVSDNGKGMTEAEQQRAFEPGWQGAASMARGDGVGLGLSIVKTLVEQHAGSVAIVRGDPGISVEITLPCS